MKICIKWSKFFQKFFGLFKIIQHLSEIWVFQIGIYSFKEIIDYRINAKKKKSKNTIGRKNMPFSVITMVCLEEHRVFVVDYFIKMESYMAMQCALRKKFQFKTHDLVLSSVTISGGGKHFKKQVQQHQLGQ